MVSSNTGNNTAHGNGEKTTVKGVTYKLEKPIWDIERQYLG